MRLLANENFPGVAIAALRLRGHDVIWIQEDSPGISDHDVLSRAVTERLSEEELAVFDLLTQPEIDLTQAEKEEVKAISKELLIKLKQERLVLDWRNTQQARAGVKVTINRTLEILPECYTDAMYDQKREVVYQHIYDSYAGAGNSIYSPAPFNPAR